MIQVCLGGVLEAFHRQPGWFEQRDIEWLEELGRHVGLAIDNAKIVVAEG